MSNFSLDSEQVINKPLLDALDEIANCNICKNIVWNPMECNKCEHCFCKSCIDNWLSQSHTCPFKCSGMSFKESRMARSMLSNLLFKCNKCGEVVKYENYENHVLSCPNQNNRNTNNKVSKFDKYDEVETEDHEHTLVIIKNNKMRKNEKSDIVSSNSLSNGSKYFWTCNQCKKNFALDVKSAFCEQCGYELCEECISHKVNQWLVHIII